MEPTVGRIVHYVDFQGLKHAAIVTHVIDERDVNLAVFYDGGVGATMQALSAITYEANPQRGYVGGSWHWPERV